jgi:hypothetical protein
MNPKIIVNNVWLCIISNDMAIKNMHNNVVSIELTVGCSRINKIYKNELNMLYRIYDTYPNEGDLSSICSDLKQNQYVCTIPILFDIFCDKKALPQIIFILNMINMMEIKFINLILSYFHRVILGPMIYMTAKFIIMS